MGGQAKNRFEEPTEELAKRHRCLVPAQRVARGVMVQCERARARDEGRARAAIAVLSAAAVAAACVVAGAAGGRAARLARGEHAVELLAHAATQKLAQAAKCDAACRTKAAAVKAAFGENLIDIHNGDHAETVQADIREKIVGRFLDPEGPTRPSAQSRGSAPRS